MTPTTTARASFSAILMATLLAVTHVMPLVFVAPSIAEEVDKGPFAKLVSAEWAEPNEAHTIPPHGTITTATGPREIVTTLPPKEDLKSDLTMTIVIKFDTSKGTHAPIRLKQRSGMLTFTPIVEDIKDDVIQPSAIDGTTAKVRLEVSADVVRLNFLKNVYYEQVKVTLPGQKKKQQKMDWTWKPFGKHDVARPGVGTES